MLFFLLLACNRNKDSLTSRIYHQMVSQFNPLFNGEQALIKGRQTLYSQHKNNYDDILRVFPTGDEDAAASVKPDMDKAVEKGTKVIERHSMMIRSDQKNQFIDDSYMLIGKARFYNREYLEALETFNYVIQQFRHNEILNEAILWAARTETALGNYLGAKEKFERIYRKEELSRDLKAMTFAAYAQLEIDKGSSSMAPYQLLEQAVEHVREKELEVRWLFIMGQLQSRMGNDYKASELFRKVVKKGPPYELLFQAQLARARNYDVDLQDPQKVFKDLKDMLSDDKNYDNRDQIYYVMAEIAEKMGDEALMEDYLKKSIRVSTTNATQKALSYFKLAETNFDNKMYPTAASYYDSAYSNLPSSHEQYPEVKRKKESLDGLVKNLKTIELQDSLIMLANLGKNQRLEKIQGMVQKEEEEADRARRAEQNRLNNAPTGDNSIALAGQSAIEGGTWYFYNQNLRSTGVREFRNRFGNRELEDNWRRKDKKTQAFNQGDGQSGGEDGGDLEASAEDAGEAPASGEDKVQEYLKNVPKTEEEIEQAHQNIIEASLNIGSIYKNELEDPVAAERQFKDLLERYPDMEDRGRVWYTLYRINVVAKDEKDAEHYKNLILNELPNSEFAALIRGEGLEEEEDQNLEARSYYDKTYQKYKEGDHRQVLRMADSGMSAFGSSPHAPQFMLLKAYAQGQARSTSKMEETLKALVAQHGGTEQAKEAQDILNHISQPEGGEGGATASGGENSSSDYKVDEKEGHKYLVIVPNTKGLVNAVTIAIIDHNKKFFKNLNLNTKSVYISPKEQMVLVSGIPNRQKAMQYFDLLKRQNVLEKYLSSNELKHFVISNSNFTEVYRDKDFTGYLDFFKNNYL